MARWNITRQGRERGHVCVAIKGVQSDPNFQQTLRNTCQATMTNEIRRHLEGWTKAQLSTLHSKNSTEATCKEIVVKVISETAERLIEEHLTSQPCMNFIRDACKDAVIEVAAATTGGDLPCPCSVLPCHGTFRPLTLCPPFGVLVVEENVMIPTGSAIRPDHSRLDFRL